MIKYIKSNVIMIRNVKNTGKSDLKQSFGGLIEIIHTTYCI